MFFICVICSEYLCSNEVRIILFRLDAEALMKKIVLAEGAGLIGEY